MTTHSSTTIDTLTPPRFHVAHPEVDGSVSMYLADVFPHAVFLCDQPQDMVDWFQAGLTAALAIRDRADELKAQAEALAATPDKVAEVIARYRDLVEANATQTEVATDTYGEVQIEVLDLAQEMWGREPDEAEAEALCAATNAMVADYRLAVTGSVS